MNVSVYRQMLKRGLVVVGELVVVEVEVASTLQNPLYLFFKKCFKFSKYSMILLPAVKILIYVVSPTEF